MAYPDSIFASGASNPGVSIGPKNILWNVITSLYTAFNNLFENFGVSIPEVAIFLAGIITILILWSIVGAIRNRKSFTLSDEPDTPAASPPPVSAEVSG